MELVEIKELSPTEITDQLKKSRTELVELRMKFASRQLENPSQIKKKRKEIARLLTIETQKLKSGEKDKKEEKVVSKEKKVRKVKSKSTKKEGN